ncbi:hypothetical protein EVAR_9998_1 [Eumeta japonica]|uniref:Uncharacterized protein n=1 Tax=Eumeta variegata TaxID=151549 RepID=A0A4C1TR19_EUMVA|nr:hypothetical protein EVAR_9998_1 [Eumeta japonica]
MSSRTTRQQVVIAAHGYSQPQRNHQCVASLFGSNKISNGGELMEEEWVGLPPVQWTSRSEPITRLSARAARPPLLAVLPQQAHAPLIMLQLQEN